MLKYHSCCNVSVSASSQLSFCFIVQLCSKWPTLSRKHNYVIDAQYIYQMFLEGLLICLEYFISDLNPFIGGNGSWMKSGVSSSAICGVIHFITE